MSTAHDTSVRRDPSITAGHDGTAPRTPYLVLDLAAVRARYRLLSSLVPGARIHYAVKANPAPQVIATLVRAGSCFDVASRPEIELCLSAGARAEDISYGSTVKKCSDIAFAHENGVRRFAFDSLAELHKIAEYAPGADVFGRLRSDGQGSVFPLDGKFGSPPGLVADLLVEARRLGLNPVGVSFHVGSQQLDPYAWGPSIAATAEIFDRVAAAGVRLGVINLGGGLPGTYGPEVPPLAEYGRAIDECLERAFGADRPEVMIEPGRSMVADAGTLHSEVVLVSRR
ncbi:MAG: type III PLP-dependent enzyme, partial [Pseudonocardia sediminis]